MTDQAMKVPPPPASESQRTMRVVIIALLAALFLVYLWRSMFITIDSGQAGVLWSRFDGGTVMRRIYGEGFHAIWPWNSMAIYNVRLQAVQDTYEVLTSDGLQVAVDVTTRFQPRAADLPVLHRSVGPGYKEIVVRPGVAAALRQVVRRFKPDDLTVVGETGLANMIASVAHDNIDAYAINLDAVLVTRIAFPKRVEDEIQEKLAQEQKALTTRYILEQTEAERQRRLVEAEGIRGFEDRSHVSILKWRGIEATEHLAASPNAKIIVIGPGEGQLPLLMNGGTEPPEAASKPDSK